MILIINSTYKTRSLTPTNPLNYLSVCMVVLIILHKSHCTQLTHISKNLNQWPPHTYRSSLDLLWLNLWNVLFMLGNFSTLGFH